MAMSKQALSKHAVMNMKRTLGLPQSASAADVLAVVSDIKAKSAPAAPPVPPGCVAVSNARLDELRAQCAAAPTWGPAVAAAREARTVEEVIESDAYKNWNLG